MSLWAKSLLRGSVAPSYLRATEPLSCIIASKNAPKYLRKPEALCSNSLHKPLVGRDQGAPALYQWQCSCPDTLQPESTFQTLQEKGWKQKKLISNLFCPSQWTQIFWLWGEGAKDKKFRFVKMSNYADVFPSNSAIAKVMCKRIICLPIPNWIWYSKTLKLKIRDAQIGR